MRFITDGARVYRMATEEASDETTVSERYAVTIPSAVRRRLDVQPGDKVRWTVSEGGGVEVEITRRRPGAFADFEPVDMGETHAATDHDAFGIGEE